MTESERKAREALDNPITRLGIWPSLSADDLRELLRLLDEAEAGAKLREARREALEEAARVCERTTPDRAAITVIGEAAHYVACAAAIRALIEQEPRT